MTEEEAEQSERRNIILQALGPDPKVRVDLTNQQIRDGDAVVLCSDGLSGQITRDEIAQVVAQDGKDLMQICGELIEVANERGGPDNITVVVARFGGTRLKAPSGRDEAGHQVYPLLDPESTTEPVPIYRGSPPPTPENKAEMIWSGGLAALVTALGLFFSTIGF